MGVASMLATYANIPVGDIVFRFEGTGETGSVLTTVDGWTGECDDTTLKSVTSRIPKKYLVRKVAGRV